ncbi:MAG TPA: EamA family transporter, partial [Dehalococcoidia bacterium]|nr:EamA family transporter [Dehalococcoidia bacterium]
MRPGRALVLTVLLIGVLAVSSAALLVRLADAPALSTAAMRMLLASVPSLALLPLHARRDARSVQRGDLPLLALSGLCLALHFATWIASLDMTTVSSSVALVTTSPLFVAGLMLAAGERVPRGTLLAIVVCLAGGLLIGYADLL